MIEETGTGGILFKGKAYNFRSHKELVYEYTSDVEYVFTVPGGVYELAIACIGTGGDGSNGITNETGGGGGGAAAAKTIISVNPGDQFYGAVLGNGDNSGGVSADGLETYVCTGNNSSGTILCLAIGGGGCPDFGNGIGGSAGDCIGDYKVSGGNGATGRYASPSPGLGGGGGSAGSCSVIAGNKFYTENGYSTFDEIGANGTTTSEGVLGNGGNGCTPSVMAQDGQIYGGGGGGGGWALSAQGQGGRGYIEFSWEITVPDEDEDNFFGQGGIIFGAQISSLPKIYFIEGFERHGVEDEELQTSLIRAWRGAYDREIVAVPGRFGGLAGEFHNYAEINLLEIQNANNIKNICVGFAVFVPNDDDTKTDAAFFRILNGSSAFLSLSTTENNYSTVTLYDRVSSVSEWPDGELVETHARKDRWNYFEIYLKVHDTSGALKIKCNNHVIYDYFGDTTTSLAGDDTFETIQFGVAAEVGQRFDEVTPSGSEVILIDDIYIADYFIDNAYISAIKYLIPIADGTHSNWSTSPFVSIGDHFGHVDDIPSNDFTNYVWNFSTVGPQESFELDDLSSEDEGDITGAIHCISIDNCASGDATTTARNLIVFDEIDYNQNEFEVEDYAVGWFNFMEIVQNNPATELPWTIEEVNLVETGLTR